VLHSFLCLHYKNIVNSQQVKLFRLGNNFVICWFISFIIFSHLFFSGNENDIVLRSARSLLR
jgi:hypothetical protein